jgi:branched-chain amino acid transport system permease protein
MVIAIVVAILLGLPILRIKGIYFILVTALFSQVVMLFIATLSGFTGGWSGVSNIPKPKLFFIDFSSQVAFYYLTLIFLALAFAFAYRLWNSQIGKVYRHIASNEALAQSVGVSLTTYKIQSFAIASVLFSLSGSFFAIHIGYINPGMFDLFVSLKPWFYLVIGGATSILGPFIGTFVVRGFGELFSFEPMLSPIIVGVIMILIILFLPRGLTSLPGQVTQFISTSAIPFWASLKKRRLRQ